MCEERCPSSSRAFSRAIDLGNNTSAMYEGDDDVEQDIVRAAELVNRSIDKGHHVYAMNELAELLETGENGIQKKDVRRAVKI